MLYWLLTFLNWWYVPEWYCAIGGQVVLQLWLFQKTWVEYGFVMRMKMVLEQLSPRLQFLAKLLAFNGVIDDINIRVTWVPVLFPGSSPIPRNMQDILMTGFLDITKAKYPTNTWQWKRADWFCSTWLDAVDSTGDHC